MPSDDMAYMKTYTEIVPPDVLQAVACSANSQDQGQVNWVSALTGDYNVLPTDPVGTDKFTVPVIDITSAQANDQIVRRVSDIIQRGQRPTTGERKRELSHMQLSCMNRINFPSTRMVYLDDIKELGLKLLCPNSFVVHSSSRNSMKTWVISE